MNRYLPILTVCLFANVLAKAQDSVHLLKTFPINSSGGRHYLAVAPGTSQLYVSHGTQVNIIDKNTGGSPGVIENTNGVHGIPFDPAYKKASPATVAAILSRFLI